MTWTENRGQSMFGQYNLTKLGIDQAWLNITNLSNRNLWLYQVSKDCLKCAYVKNTEVQNVPPDASKHFIVSTRYPLTYRLETSGENDIVLENATKTFHCKVETSMGEFGVYEMTAKETNCEFRTVLEPVSIYLPFLIPFLIYLGIGAVCVLWKLYGQSIVMNSKVGAFFQGSKSDQTTIPSQHSNTNQINQNTKRPRLRSLDTFRGICIVIMMFVHDGSASYYFLDHATWDGLYIADLVFPWFLWIMGVCIPVSIKSQLKKNIPKLTIFKRILIRSFKLAAIGIILNSKGGPVEWNTLRFPGVLQRFAVCYLIAASTMLVCADKSFVENIKSKNKYVAKFQDIAFIWKGWLISILAVILHTCLTFLLPVPDCPTGYLGPGGLHNQNKISGKCVGGAAGYIDRKVLGEKHIYQWPTAKATYGSEAYDPEGLLGNLTAILTVWLGVQTGLALHVFSKHRSRIFRWSVWAVVTGGLGALLCGAKQTEGLIPLNKNLWSLSFVLVLSSFAVILLICLYLLIDVWRLWSGTPFYEPGMNSLLLYIAHLIAYNLLPWHFQLKQMNTHFVKLMESLWGISLWVLYAIYLCRQKYFWKL